MTLTDEPCISIYNIPLPVLVCDQTGKILWVNDAFMTEIGYARNTLVGTSVDALVPLKKRGKHKEHRETYHLNPKYRLMVESKTCILMLTPSGGIRKMMIGLTPLPEGKVACFIVPVSAGKRFWRNPRFVLAGTSLLLGSLMMMIVDLKNLGLILCGSAVAFLVSYLEEKKRDSSSA